MVMWVVTEMIGSFAFRRISVPQIVWTRYFFHLTLMLLILGVPRRFDFVRTGRPWLQISRSLLMLLMPASFAIAREAGLATTMAIFWVSPLIILLLAPLIGDRSSAFLWWVSGFAWIGVLLMHLPGVLAAGWHTIAALIMATSFGAYIVVTRVLDRTEALLTNLFYTAIGVFAVLTVALPSFWIPLTPRQFAGGALLASSGWCALYLLERAIRSEKPSRLAPFFYVQALMEIALRVVDRGTVPALHVVLGALVTAAAHQCGDREDRPRPCIAQMMRPVIQNGR